ncbi:hypothetical protein AAVH_35161, partial [Aphelenchoides avenae]
VAAETKAEGGSTRERECPQGGRRTTARRRTQKKVDGRPEVLRGLRRAEKTREGQVVIGGWRELSSLLGCDKDVIFLLG